MAFTTLTHKLWPAWENGALTNGHVISEEDEQFHPLAEWRWRSLHFQSHEVCPVTNHTTAGDMHQLCLRTLGLPTASPSALPQGRRKSSNTRWDWCQALSSRANFQQGCGHHKEGRIWEPRDPCPLLCCLTDPTSVHYPVYSLAHWEVWLCYICVHWVSLCRLAIGSLL